MEDFKPGDLIRNKESGSELTFKSDWDSIPDWVVLQDEGISFMLSAESLVKEWEKVT